MTTMATSAIHRINITSDNNRNKSNQSRTQKQKMVKRTYLATTKTYHCGNSKPLQHKLVKQLRKTRPANNIRNTKINGNTKHQGKSNKNSQCQQK
jgi:hypothetical protein